MVCSSPNIMRLFRTIFSSSLPHAVKVEWLCLEEYNEEASGLMIAVSN
jgi:hypothetical protein